VSIARTDGSGAATHDASPQLNTSCMPGFTYSPDARARPRLARPAAAGFPGRTHAFAFAGASFAATPQASTAAPAKPRTAQQQRMADCNKEATGKKGDERKAFMSSCLKGQSMAAAPSAKATQQEKMKTCNADAKTKALKGAERKTFMSGCLKSDAAAPAAH
jgi:hypothetical protein